MRPSPLAICPVPPGNTPTIMRPRLSHVLRRTRWQFSKPSGCSQCQSTSYTSYTSRLLAERPPLCALLLCALAVMTVWWVDWGVH
jgi:hypothetical protein